MTPMIFKPLNLVPCRALGVLALAACLTWSAPASAQNAFSDPGAKTTGATGGDMTAVQTAIDAGAVALGSASQIVVLLRNDDTKPLTLGEISLYPSSNVSATVSENQCDNEPLAPQAVCAIALSIKGLQSGRFRVETLARHNGRARLLTVSVNGTVDSSSNESGTRNNDMELVPETIDFGSLDASRTQMMSVMLRNITSQTIDVQSVSVQSDTQAGYSVDGECGTLTSGGACVLTVTWTPQQVGPSTGSVLVKHNGPTGVINIPLQGRYEPSSGEEAPTFAEAVPGKGLLVSSLSQVDFGSGIDKSSSITVSLVNAGDAPLTLRNMILSNTENGITIERSGCTPGRVLNPIEACPMTLSWTPVREGTVLDDVTISHTGVRNLLVLPVRGTASKAVSRDSKAINLGDFSGIRPLSVGDLGADIDADGGSGATSSASGARSSGGRADLSAYQVQDVRGVLDGYSITSLSTSRAIIAGPGGSRVVSNGENTVIGGVPWLVTIRQGAAQFDHGEHSIILLFDRSLSLINSNNSQSSNTVFGSTSSTSSTGSTSSAP